MNKKGNAALIIILIILVIAFLIINLAANSHIFQEKECRKNEDCTTEQYCGSDFECHELPTLQKTVINNVHDYRTPAFIIALGLIVTAFIFKSDIDWKKLIEKLRQRRNLK